MGHLALALAALPLLTVPASAAVYDEALYAELLTRHTRQTDDIAQVRIDYAALKQSDDWKRLVASVEAADLSALATREQRLAFWINAYNILAADLVARSWPVESIKDLGSFLSPVWKQEAWTIGGEPRSLHEIEHDILRPMGEPRIHGAIVCASLSCPPLRREPWQAGKLEAQLDDNLRTWLANEQKGLRLEAARRTVHLSSIFDWFEEDFEPAGGVLAFVQRYAPQPGRSWLAQNAGLVSVRYLDYDWRVNAP